tara:strand:+ start:823 stop:1173 length:351 start_codon:yes stop_codon:yes gene_type:complete
MKRELYVRFDIESNTITAGPQGGMDGQDGWRQFVPAPNKLPRDTLDYVVDEDYGAVIQYVTGSAPEPDTDESRSLHYPKIAEQLDKLFHDIDNGTLDDSGEFYTALKAVKDAYPKA